MKKSLFIIFSFGFLMLVGCAKNQPEDLTKFSESTLTGKWVAINDSNYVDYIYDIISETDLVYYEASDAETEFSWDGITEYHSHSYYKDGCLYTSQKTTWEKAGVVQYVFDDAEQLINGTGGDLWGFDVSFILGLLGSPNIFRVERVGKDEAYLYDLTGWIRDTHVFRIEEEKQVE